MSLATKVQGRLVKEIVKRKKLTPAQKAIFKYQMIENGTKVMLPELDSLGEITVDGVMNTKGAMDKDLLEAVKEAGFTDEDIRYMAEGIVANLNKERERRLTHASR